MRRIELPNEELAEELQKHLENGKFPGSTCDKARKSVEFAAEMSSSQWSALKAEVERWAKGRRLEAVESLTLQFARPQESLARAQPSGQDAGVKKRLESLTPQQAEQRFNYLQSKPFSELTDAEYDERLALAERLSAKPKARK